MASRFALGWLAWCFCCVAAAAAAASAHEFCASNPDLFWKPKLTLLIVGSEKIVRRDGPALGDGWVAAWRAAHPGAETESCTIVMENKTQVPLVRAAEYFEKDPTSSAPHRTLVILCLSLSSCGEPETYARLPAGAYVSRLPSLRETMWGKSSLCSALPRWLTLLISFECYVLPRARAALLARVRESADEAPPQWILKPWFGGGGDGIKVTRPGKDASMLDISRHAASNYVVSTFLQRPLLVDGRKFDLRLFALVAHFPGRHLRVWVHREGIVRFSTPSGIPYEPQNSKHYLTNTAVTKHKGTLDATVWPLSRLWSSWTREESARARLSIDALVGLTIVASGLKRKITPVCQHGLRCYGLLGFDVIFQAEDRAPKLLEVNGEPSMAGKESGSFYDRTKEQVSRDVGLIFMDASHPTGFRPVYPNPQFECGAFEPEADPYVEGFSRLEPEDELESGWEPRGNYADVFQDWRWANVTPRVPTNSHRAPCTLP